MTDVFVLGRAPFLLALRLFLPRLFPTALLISCSYQPLELTLRML